MHGSVDLGDVVIASHSYAYPERHLYNGLPNEQNERRSRSQTDEVELSDDSDSDSLDSLDSVQPMQLITETDQALLRAVFATTNRHAFNPSASIKDYFGDLSDTLTSNQCQVRLGPMGCGSLLVKDANFMNYLQKIVPTTLAVDMECNGLATAALRCNISHTVGSNQSGG